MTIDALTSLDAIRTELGTESMQLERASRAYEGVLQGIPNRFHFSTDDGFNAELEAYEPTRTAGESALATAAERAKAAAYAALDQLKADTATLPSSEESRAATLQPLIRDEVERLAWSELAAKVRSAALTGDQAAQWLYLRYGTMRLAMNAGETLAPEAQQARSAVESALYTLKQRFVSDDAERTQEVAQALLSKAHKLHAQATARKTAQQTFRFQKGNEVRW